MQKLIICRGLPASGKSTWAKKFVEDNPQWKRVNRDTLRSMVHGAGKFTREREAAIKIARDALVKTFLAADYNVIVDDTNLDPAVVEHLRGLTTLDVEVEEKWFHVTLDEALARNAMRTEFEGKVPMSVIKNMHRKWLHNETDRHAYIPHDPSLPSAVIFDLDGTLAIARHRDVYDGSLCESDDINSPVVEFLHFIRECPIAPHRGPIQVIFCSGREDEFRPQTENWLMKHGLILRGDLLLMRASDDKRNDAIVKREIFEQHIAGKFNVLAAFDDRNRVVKMWRSVGVPCFQVCDGDF